MKSGTQMHPTASTEDDHRKHFALQKTSSNIMEISGLHED